MYNILFCTSKIITLLAEAQTASAVSELKTELQLTFKY